MRRTKAARRHMHGRNRRSPFKSYESSKRLQMKFEGSSNESKPAQQAVEDENIDAAKSVANNDGSGKGMEWQASSTGSYIEQSQPRSLTDQPNTSNQPQMRQTNQPQATGASVPGWEGRDKAWGGRSFN